MGGRKSKGKKMSAAVWLKVENEEKTKKLCGTHSKSFLASTAQKTEKHIKK